MVIKDPGNRLPYTVHADAAAFDSLDSMFDYGVHLKHESQVSKGLGLAIAAGSAVVAYGLRKHGHDDLATVGLGMALGGAVETVCGMGLRDRSIVLKGGAALIGIAQEEGLISIAPNQVPQAYSV